MIRANVSMGEMAPSRLPPPLPQSRRGRALVPAAAATAGALAAMFLATRVVAGALPYPGCGFKHLTGLACPGCGGLRSLGELAHGHVAEALALNPLAVAGAVLFVLALPAAALDAAVNRGRGAAWLGRAAGGWRIGWLCAGVVAATWVYLLAVGR